MTYDLKEFKEKKPVDIFCEEIVDTETAMHVARWSENQFDSFEDFVVFTYKFSSVTQPLIQGKECEQWFCEDNQALANTRLMLKDNAVMEKDSTALIDTEFGSFEIPWLKQGDHDKSVLLPAGELDEYPTLLSSGLKGYLTAFVADLLI